MSKEDGALRSFFYWLGIQKKKDLKDVSLLDKDGQWLFQIDDKKRLYWNGNRVVTTGISFIEIVGFLSLIIGVAVAGATLFEKISNIMASKPTSTISLDEKNLEKSNTKVTNP